MAAIERRSVVPTTRSGWIGVVLAAVAIVAFVLAVALDSPDTGRNPFAFTWGLVVVSGAVELFAILRRGERSVLGFVALAPFAFLLVLLVMEATGLME